MAWALGRTTVHWKAELHLMEKKLQRATALAMQHGRAEVANCDVAMSNRQKRSI
jgi:hypothetical protein